MATRLPEVVSEALEAAQAIKDERSRAGRLRTLAQHLPEEHLMQVLEATQTINAEWERGDILSDLKQRFPEEQLVQVLEAARTISDEWPHANVLSALAKRLPEVTLEALQAVWTIQEASLRARLLSALTQPMLNRSIEECYQYMDTCLAKLSQRTRSNLFSDISALLPIIIRLGTPDTSREIYEAVHDVTTWWP